MNEEAGVENICIGCPAADIPLSNFSTIVLPLRVCSTEQLNTSVNVDPKQELATVYIVEIDPIFSIKSEF